MLAILSSLGLLHSGGQSRNVLVPPLKIAMMGGVREGELITIFSLHFQEDSLGNWNIHELMEDDENTINPGSFHWNRVRIYARNQLPSQSFKRLNK